MNRNFSKPSDITPENALNLLIEGNKRFVAGKQGKLDLLQMVRDHAEGQWPFAVVLSCIDSRAPAELILDQGIGDIFSVRIAGNFVNEDILGSMEFGCKITGSKVVLVMGHRHCGAVRGACNHVELGNLTAMLAKIEPAVQAVTQPADPKLRTADNDKFVHDVARKNVELVTQQIRERSPVLAELEADGSLIIVGSMYDVETGEIDFWI